MRYTVADFNKEFPDEDSCLQRVFDDRYGDVKDCPYCGVINTKFYRVRGRKCFACMHCGYQLHPLAQTIFHKSSTPLKSWFYALYLFSVSKNGVAAKELERHLGVHYQTALRMTRQIRKLMEQDTSKLGGEGKTIEADETYFGKAYKTKRGLYRKTPVLGVVERGGAVRAMVVDTASSALTKRFFADRVVIESELHTDESRIYLWTNSVMKHENVMNSKWEYARLEVTTNSIEGFWGILKSSIAGTYRGVSERHLQSYVDEFAWRYSHRDEAVYPLLWERAVKRV